jgi:hypothetical protein
MRAFPELEPWTNADGRTGGLANARSDIGREIAGLLDDRRLPAECPQEVTDSARLAVATGFPLWACVQAYRTGHAIQWDAWSDAVEAQRLDRADRRALLRAGSEYMFAYADRCSRWIEVEYTRARDREIRSEEQLRIQLVRDLLDGHHADASTLGYPLDAWHIAAIGTGRDTEDALQQLAGTLKAQLLIVAADAFTWWAWLDVTQTHRPRTHRQLPSLTLPSGSTLALGEPGEGRDGFRQSHQEAQYAALIGARRCESVTRYGDVALESLGLANPERARAFVTRELGPLSNDDRRSRILRETLIAYFATAQRGSSAALVLGVHERTVGNRLRAIDQMIGHSVVSRRAEIETALRINELLGPRDTEPPN